MAFNPLPPLGQAVAASSLPVVIASNQSAIAISTVPADPFGTNADAASATGSISAKLSFIASTGIPVTGTVAAASAGDVDHDEVDSGKPIKVGHKAIAHGTDPTAVAVNDRTNWYANRHGIPFILGGHPNIVTQSVVVNGANGAQTNVAMKTVSAGSKIAVTRVILHADNGNTASPNILVGFASSTLPTPNTTTGGIGILADARGMGTGTTWSSGDGSGILGVGGDGEDLRYTCEDPGDSGSNITITVSYFTIES